MKVQFKKVFLLINMLLALMCRGWSQQYHHSGNDIKTNIDSTTVDIQFYTTGIVRILKYQEGERPVKKNFSVIKRPENVAVQVIKQKDDILMRTKALILKLSLKSGQICFYDTSAKLLLKEHVPAVLFDNEQDNYSVSQSFDLEQQEAIYGLGQQQNGKLDQRNQELVLAQRNMHIGIPFFQSAKGYGLFWDNDSKTIFKDSLDIVSFRSDIGRCADYYFIRGKNADKVIAGMRELTGEAPMFPRWAFGYWQSRERYQSQEQLLDVVRKYRALQVPLDGIVQDWQYWGTDNKDWNATDFGNPAFPNPKEMIDSVHQLHAHIIISVWPSFGRATEIYQVLQKDSLLFGFNSYPPSARVYDAFSAKARNIYWHYLNKNLFSKGIDGWWLDATEPEIEQPEKADLGILKKYRNAFPLVTTGGVYQHQREETSAKRVFILTRSSFAGQQRNATVIWSGDITSGWQVLHHQIAGGLNLSLCGIPYWNTDIGGFFAGRHYPGGAKDPAYQELYVRWLQFGAFTPMMRSHGTYTPREIYQFGQKGFWAYDAIDKFIKLRYRLLPYNYSEAWQVTDHASTMMRALVMDFPADRKVWDMDDEYMFGKSFLICPVTDSMYARRNDGHTFTDFSKAKTKAVYLPAGAKWIDFWTGERFDGGQSIQKKVPIDIMPLYVKAGSIVPMGPFQEYTGEKSNRKLELRIYGGANGSFTLYEDENDNYDYEKGIYTTIRMKWNEASKILTIGNRKGHFPGMLRKRLFDIILVKKDHGGGIGITNQPDKVVTYTGKQIKVKFL